MTDQRTAPARPPLTRALELVEGRNSGTTIAARDMTTMIAVDNAEDSAVLRAVDDLHADLHAVTGGLASIVTDSSDATIVVGTLGTSAMIDRAIDAGVITLDGLLDDDGSPHWEGFVLREIAGTLWIIGADRRGTIFGIYTLTEAAGVSPWRWWADVPDRSRDHVTIPTDALIADHPSVRYRGLFLNDEEELDAWARAHTPDGTIGPATYERLFELLLRLRANYVWPAMHVNAFNADPENGRLAHRMGIVVGTSHCDMLLRSNQHEWEPWQAANDAEWVEYDYSIPGANREALRGYWRGSVEQNRDHEATWTLGMRGIHDSGFHTRAIDEDSTLDEEQKHRARVDLLGEVIRDQRAVLAQGLAAGEPMPLQTFVPYKEVLDLYDAGLDVPDDVTIIWSDDSFGHVRRYPNDDEQLRSGGHGLYYHSSYWSPPSRSYLWISSMPLAHMQHELRTAWNRGIRTLWVDNIGSLKPLEQDAEFFLRSAWEAGRETTTANPTQFLQQWIDRSFSGGHGATIAAMLDVWAETTHLRRVEHLTTDAFTQTADGDQAARRLAVLRDCFDTACVVHDALPMSERAAFFELILLRVAAAYLTNAQFVFAGRSTLSARQGKAQAADDYLDRSRRFDRLRRSVVAHYNHGAAAGKWSGIMTPDAFPPPATALYPAATPSLVVGEPGIGVVVRGAAVPSTNPTLILDPARSGRSWIEVFNTGAGTVGFRIDADAWLQLDTRHGSVTTERRIAVDLQLGDYTPRTGTIVITELATGRRVDVTVRVVPVPEMTDPHRFLESDGIVSMPAASAVLLPAGPTDAAWRVLRRSGRPNGDLLETQLPTEENGSAAEFRFTLRTAGAHRVVLHRGPSLDATSRLRVQLDVDDFTPVTLESPTTDEYRGAWTSMVVEQTERLELRLPFLEAGDHRVLVRGVDPGFILTHIVLMTEDGAPTTTPPDPSPRPAAPHDPASGRRDPAPDQHDVDDVETALVRLGVHTDAATAHPAVFIRRDYWDAETTFTPNTVIPDSRPYEPVAAFSGTAKDRPAALPRGTVPETNGSIAIDLERALADTADAWLTDALDDADVGWTHTQAETQNGRGIALHVDTPDRHWDDPTSAPGIHIKMAITTPGTYRLWALVKFDSDQDDAFDVAINRTLLPSSSQFSGGDMFSFGAAQAWVWVEIADIDLEHGRHTISILARKPRLRLARLFLTRTDELPPTDASWPTTAHQSVV